MRELIAARIRQAREDAGYTQEQLGLKMGYTEASAKNSIYLYESGRSTPRHKVLEKLADVLNKPVAYFTTDNAHSADVEVRRFQGEEERKLLVEILTDIEDYLEENGLKLRAALKAELAIYLYDERIKSKSVSATGLLDRLMPLIKNDK